MGLVKDFLFTILRAVPHLHVSLQLQQVEPVPGDESRALVREVHPTEAGLPGAQERLADRVVVGPHEVVVDGDVLELHGVAVGPEDLGVAAGGDHQVGVHGALGLVQRVHEGTLLVRAELHHVSPDWSVEEEEEEVGGLQQREEKWIILTSHALIGPLILMSEERSTGSMRGMRAAATYR